MERAHVHRAGAVAGRLRRVALRWWLALGVALTIAGSSSAPALAAGQSLYVGNNGTTLTVYPTSASGNASPSNTVDQGAATSSLGFDPHGNLWVGSGSGGPGSLREYTPAALATSGSQPSVTITTSWSGLTAGIAFDPSGNLWIVDLGNGAGGNGHIDEFTTAQLASSGTKSPAVSIGGISYPNGVAFDSGGNMWVSSYGSSTLSRFTPAQLGSSGSPTPGVVISGSGLTNPARLKFDASGSLWVANNGGTTVVKYTASQLGASGAPTPAVTLSSNAGSLSSPNGLDFDASGDLWVVNSQSSTAVEYSPGQITASGAPAPVNQIAGASTGLQTPYTVVVGPTPNTGATTGTALSCTYFFQTGTDTCDATVGPVQGQQVPTGSVSFTSSNTTNGGLFTSGTSCPLTPIQGGGATAGCSVQFAPGMAATTLTAAYSGDGTYAPSSGTFTICNNPQNGLASCNLPDVTAAQCRADAGAPLCQTTFAVCVSFWSANCIGFGTPPAPLQVCVSAWQNCNGFGTGRQPSSATIDLSGFPASVVTPVSCNTSSRGVRPSPKRDPTASAAAGGGASCSVEDYLNQNADSQTVRNRTTRDSEFQRRTDRDTFLNAANLREATIIDSAQRALDGVEATWEHLNTNIPDAPPLRAVLAYKNVASVTVHTLFREATNVDVPVTHIVPPLNDTECFNALNPDPSSPPEVLSFVQDLGRTCSIIVDDVNQRTVSALQDLKELKHRMGLDVPFRITGGGGAPQTKARKPPRRRPRRVRFRGLPVIGYGTATVRLNHRGRLRIAIPAWERREFRALRRRGVRRIKATLVMEVGRVPTGLHYHVSTPVTIWLVHPPKKHHRPARRRRRR